MRIDEALELGRQRLRLVAERPLLEAQILLGHLLQRSRTFLHAHPEYMLSPQEEEAFLQALQRRMAHEPIEYITQEVSFFAETFAIWPGVLIPRPETERLVEELLGELEGRERVAEVGIGSGVISLTLKRLMPGLTIWGSDIDPKAVELARYNQKRLGVEVEFVEASYLEGAPDPIDVIVSNPPYIAPDYPLPPSIAQYEPSQALFGGAGGVEVIRKLIDLFTEGEATILGCEMGYDQRSWVEGYLEEIGFQGRCRFFQDLAGWDRGFILRKGD
ncbi:MAG: peptide chain release factor N(5)-glutamine methyltransferase [Nitratiruptor sp.]|nr:peptide chain release factor N(5)-glutamine methyltransferase [Nitratiruptor sp.]NPA83277.1 peptide chain release factor N(5)-glutamine methyltransferase [Campylobacterota bacterium]